ncbi:MAG: PspC domain-containing protein [Anaerolineales bacterium]
MAEKKKKLYRSRNESWLVGVCGGIAEYFDIDSTVIRVLFVLGAFILGGGLWIYLILWIIMPLNPDEFGLGDVTTTDEPPADEPPAEEAE